MNTTTKYTEAAQRKWAARGNKPLSREAKTAQIKKLLKQGGANKVAAAFVGPIIIRLAYQGITRSILLEDYVESGVTREYDVLDDWGKAYKLHSMEGQVKIERFEGKRVLPDYYRIASEWEVKRADLEFLNASTIDFAEEQTAQRIMEREDSDLLSLLDAAIADWTTLHTGADSDGEATANPNTITNADTSFTLDSFLDASARIATQRLNGTRLVMNPADVYDMYKWEVKDVGLEFKEQFFAGNKLATFGDFTIVTSVIVPRKTIYVLPDPEYVGVLSVRYGLEAADDPTGVSQFVIRKVYNELIGMLILNSAGLTKITKA